MHLATRHPRELPELRQHETGPCLRGSRSPKTRDGLGRFSPYARILVGKKAFQLLDSLSSAGAVKSQGADGIQTGGWIPVFQSGNEFLDQRIVHRTLLHDGREFRRTRCRRGSKTATPYDRPLGWPGSAPVGLVLSKNPRLGSLAIRETSL